MKGIILSLLISYIFCINYLPKYDTIKVTENFGYFYLNTNEFDDDSTLNIHLKVKNGIIVSTLLYEFTNVSPNSYSSVPLNTLTPTSTNNSTTKVNKVTVSYTQHYYYSLKIDKSYSYLIILYMGLSGEYLEIERTKANEGIILSILMIFSAIYLVIVIIIITKRCRRHRNYENKVIEAVFPNPYEKPYYSNDPQYNSGYYNSYFPQQQLQDINDGPSINN